MSGARAERRLAAILAAARAVPSSSSPISREYPRHIEYSGAGKRVASRRVTRMSATRRLAAILAANVAGYSPLLGLKKARSRVSKGGGERLFFGVELS